MLKNRQTMDSYAVCLVPGYKRVAAQLYARLIFLVLKVIHLNDKVKTLLSLHLMFKTCGFPRSNKGYPAGGPNSSQIRNLINLSKAALTHL